MSNIQAAAIFDKILSADDSIKLTTLRKEILTIFIQSKKPISAYEVLKELKAQRETAEPPTVYRVIEYLIEKKILHRIDTENKYVFCSHLENTTLQYHGILFICKTCHTAIEVIDKPFDNFLAKLSTSYHFTIDDSPVEIKGVYHRYIDQSAVFTKA